MSDNGPQFTSVEFERCMKLNGIKHIKVAPYHPSSNGAAERCVQTFKHAMKAAKKDEGSLNVKIAIFIGCHTFVNPLRNAISVHVCLSSLSLNEMPSFL